MGQYLSNVNSQIVDWTNKNETVLSPESIVSGNGKESINLFLSIKTLADTTINSTQYDTNNQILNSEKLLIKQIQNYLLLLTKSNEVIEINTKINKILIENGFMPVIDHYQKALQEMKAIFDKQQQLQKSLRKKLDDDNNNDRSIFAESCIESSTKEKNIPPVATTTSIDSAQKSTVAQQRIEIEAQQFSYFAIQLLTSLLLVSIKANERVDPSITSQIIILASQLCEQIPIKYLLSFELSSNSNSLMFKSLKPLINYINELSLSTDPILATQATQILLKFSIVQASFKDLLPIISKLIFNTTDIFNVRYLFLQLNNCLTETINQFEQEKQQLDNGSQDDSNYREDKANDTISKKTTG
ncbi:unnamed protein product [Rotaria sordida]|uniref:Uncharacterized protein n=1 Tax=Rotaria sordida TaxID=392033 RepID=A0A814M568_9BILA|nr:unnamed protein product [Rotaria sordida]CAF3652326.1 unnamed protein product [Rotaria sordida]